MAEPFNQIAGLPANSNGARTVLEEHLDVNNGVVAAFLAALVKGTFASGGVIDAGTITVEPDGVTVTVEGRSGITNDLQAAVVVREQSVDCSGIADGNKGRVYISRELAEHVQVNFTDADTGEALTHTLGVVLGKLQVIEGDAANYPALPPGSVPVAKISKAAGVVSVDAAEDDAPVVRGGGGGGGNAYYDLQMGFAGSPSAGAADVVLLPRAMTIDNADPGEVYVGTNPTDGTAVFDVQVNGVSVGGIEITTSGVVTWDLAAPVVLAAGDRLALVAPTPADATLADVLVALRGAAT